MGRKADFSVPYGRSEMTKKGVPAIQTSNQRPGTSDWAAQPPLFQVLDLFPCLFDHRLELQPKLGDPETICGIGSAGLGEQRI